MFESKINRGRANGYAPLDGSGKVPLDKLPPIQSTINTGSFVTTNQTGSFVTANQTGSFATTSSLQRLVNVTASFATTGSNIFRGNQSISGSVNISSSLIISSTVVNSGSIEALNSDLIIDGGDIIVTGSINLTDGNIILSGSFIQQVNYAPMASGSFNDVASEEVTQLDITKDIHLLDTTGGGVDANFHWFLPDGLYDGQVVRFALKGDNDTNPNYVRIWMNHIRINNGTTQNSFPWYPFWNNLNGSARSLATALYIDGAWNIDTDFWDM